MEGREAFGAGGSQQSAMEGREDHLLRGKPLGKVLGRGEMNGFEAPEQVLDDEPAGAALIDRKVNEGQPIPANDSRARLISSSVKSPRFQRRANALSASG